MDGNLTSKNPHYPQLTSRLNSKITAIPGQFIPELIETLSAYDNDSTDFSHVAIKRSLHGVYGLLITLFVTLTIFGCISNFILLAKLSEIAKKFMENGKSVAEFVFVAHGAGVDMALCVLVAPVSLAVLLVRTWVMGRVLCFFVPVAQDVLMYTSLSSLCLASAARYTSRLPPPQRDGGSLRAASLRHGGRVAATALVIMWVIVTAAVAPQATFIEYFDLEGSFGPQFENVALCIVRRSSGLRRYHAVLFVLLYCLPLAASSAMHHRTQALIKTKRLARVDEQLEERQNNQRDRDNRKSSPCSDPDAQYEEFDYSCFDLGRDQLPGDRDVKESSPVYEEVSPPKVNVAFIQVADGVLRDEEEKAQFFWVAMTVVCGVSLAPLMVVRLTRTTSSMTSEELDTTSAWLALLSLLHTVSTPVLFLWGHCTLRKPTSDSATAPNPNSKSSTDTFKLPAADSSPVASASEHRKPPRNLLRSGVVPSFGESTISALEPPPLPSRPPPSHLPLQLSSSSGCLLQPPRENVSMCGSLSPSTAMYPLTNFGYRSQRHHSLHSSRSLSPSVIPITPPNSPNHWRLTPTLSVSSRKSFDCQASRSPCEVHFCNYVSLPTPHSPRSESTTLNVHAQLSPLHSRTSSSLSFCRSFVSPQSPISFPLTPSIASPSSTSRHRLVLPAESKMFGTQAPSGRLLTPARSRTIHRISDDKRIRRY